MFSKPHSCLLIQSFQYGKLCILNMKREYDIASEPYHCAICKTDLRYHETKYRSTTSKCQDSCKEVNLESAQLYFCSSGNFDSCKSEEIGGSSKLSSILFVDRASFVYYRKLFVFQYRTFPNDN